MHKGSQQKAPDIVRAACLRGMVVHMLELQLHVKGGYEAAARTCQYPGRCSLMMLSLGKPAAEHNV